MTQFDNGGHTIGWARYTYDTAGNPADTITYAGTTADVYSATNRLTREIVYAPGGSPMVSSTSMTYLASGLMATSIDGDDNVTSDTYNSAGLQTVELVSLGHEISSTSMVYDAAGRVTQQFDGTATPSLPATMPTECGRIQSHRRWPAVRGHSAPHALPGGLSTAPTGG